jgi:hypothetical protein
MKESWVIIKKFNGHYSVSSKGRIKSKKRSTRFLSKNGKECFKTNKEKILSQQLNNNGYLIVHLWFKNKRYVSTVHSLVTQYFHGERPHKNVVRHANGIRTDNRSKNLSYSTVSENLKDMIKHGSYPMTGSKLTVTQVKLIKKMKGKVLEKQLAEKYNLKSSDTISRIWRGVSWSHV